MSRIDEIKDRTHRFNVHYFHPEAGQFFDEADADMHYLLDENKRLREKLERSEMIIREMNTHPG